MGGGRGFGIFLSQGTPLNFCFEETSSFLSWLPATSAQCTSIPFIDTPWGGGGGRSQTATASVSSFTHYQKVGEVMEKPRCEGRQPELVMGCAGFKPQLEECKGLEMWSGRASGQTPSALLAVTYPYFRWQVWSVDDSSVVSGMSGLLRWLLAPIDFSSDLLLVPCLNSNSLNTSRQPAPERQGPSPPAKVQVTV